MLVDRLLNMGPTPLLERELKFTDARQELIADNIANVSTPDYLQKDLSVEKFQAMLRKRIKDGDKNGPGTTRYDDIDSQIDHPTGGILFHDGNNRSMEQLMTDNAKNALMHNLVVELLRRQYQTMDMALKERVS